MARSLRFQFPGALYHISATGFEGGKIFRDDADRELFLRTLSEVCERMGWRVHAWVLLNQAYSLVLETPQPNLVEGMQWLQNTFTRRIHPQHRNRARLFGDRY